MVFQLWNFWESSRFDASTPWLLMIRSTSDLIMDGRTQNIISVSVRRSFLQSLDVSPTPSVLPQAASAPFCLSSMNFLIIWALDVYNSISTTVFQTVELPGIFAV